MFGFLYIYCIYTYILYISRNCVFINNRVKGFSKVFKAVLYIQMVNLIVKW